MAEIMYNGVVLPYCRTTQYDQVVTYDAETDWYKQNFSIGVETYFTSEYLQLLAPQLIGRTDNAAMIMKVIRSSLMQPRRPFSVKCSGVEVIPQPVQGNNGTVDAANGPQPQYCNVIQMNDSTFIVMWAIKASYWENNRVNIAAPVTVTNQPGNPVLVNRWSETQDIDKCMYTTRTREGKYIIRSDNRQGLIVDRFREQMAILAVPTGFLRESSSYTVSPDGLSLSYRIVDKEQFKMPPSMTTPVYEAQGQYTEQVMKYGAQRWGEVRLTLKGSKITDQGKLILAALGIASAKLDDNGAKKINAVGGNENALRFSIMEYCHLTVNMYENIVSLTMRARMLQGRIFTKEEQAAAGPGNVVGGKYWGWNTTSLAFTPGSDDADPVANRPINLIGGSTTGPPGVDRMLLQAAAYYDPSLAGVRIDKDTGQFTGGLLEVGQAGLRREN